MARLSVSETKEGERHIFTGTIHKLDTAPEIVTSGQFSIMDSLMDVAIVINDQGVIQFFNKVAEKMFGYSKTDVHGKNIRSLMPEPFRRYFFDSFNFCSEHDTYLSNYRRSKIAKVIGTGRDVPIEKKDGSIAPVNLKLTEQEINGRLYFTGILTPLSEKAEKETKSHLETERDVLNTLLLPALIIDTKGVIQSFNPPASKIIGYSLSEVIGKNITMLMGGTDKTSHDSYLKKYSETGVSSIIGLGRKVNVVTKNGDSIACKLWVTEKHDKEIKFFSGILQPIEK
jgi:PAS domain S-box-containing protein